MSLYNRRFVRTLRRRVAAEVKRNPKWKAEKRAARAPRQYNTESLALFVLPLAALAGAFGFRVPDVALAALVALSTFVIVWRAGEIQFLVFGRAGLAPFLQFPVGRDFALDYIEKRLLRKSFWIAAIAAAVFAGGALQTRGGHWLGVAVGAVLVWAAVLSASVVWVWRAPAFPFRVVIGFCSTFGLVALIVGARLTPLTIKAVSAGYEAARWWLPTGWAAVTAEWLIFGRPEAPVAPMLLLFGLVALAVFARRELRAQFSLWETAATTIADKADPAPVVRASEIEERILARAFLASPVQVGRDVIERCGCKLLSPRERPIADMLLLRPPGWSRRYLFGGGCVAASPWIQHFLPAPFAEFPWILIFGLFIGIATVTPLFGGVWPGFSTAAINHRRVAFFTFWPVTVREVRNCILKLNFVRCLFALPWWLYAGGGVAALSGASIPSGIAVAAKGWLICLLLQPFYLVFKLSAGTNDTSGGCLFVLGFYVLAFSVLASAVAAAVFSLMGDKPLWWVGAVAALAVLSWSFEALYRKAWRSQQFDLLARPRNYARG